MKRLLTIVILSTVIVGGLWALYHRQRIQSPADFFQLVQEQFAAWQGSPSADRPLTEVPWDPQTLRVATFNIQTFGEKKGSDPQVMAYLAEICRQFDVIAIQEVRGADPQWLAELTALMNCGPAWDFSYAVSDPLGRGQYRERAAFVFNRVRLQIDHAIAYAVDDPDELMVRPPYVGWFRAIEVPPSEAFTFSLVNVHVDPDQPRKELAYLRELFRAVRKDGRNEDDVIIAGDFNAGDQGLEHLRRFGFQWVVSHAPTNTRFTAQYDNLVFDQRSTIEFRGQGGVFNFVKYFNLSLDQALAISDHMPVWGEFSVCEGFEPGRTADSHSEAEPIR